MNSTTRSARKLKDLILSFSNSKFYRVSVTGTGSKVTFTLAPKISKTLKFVFLLQIEDNGFAMGTYLGKGEEKAIDDTLVFTCSPKRACVLSNQSIAWLPVKPKPSLNGVFANEWIITKKTFFRVYSEATRLLRAAKELEKLGCYFENCWEPSVCGEIWVADKKGVCRSVSQQTYKSLVSDLYTKHTLKIITRKLARLDISLTFDHEKYAELRDEFVAETLNNKTKFNIDFYDEVCNRVRVDVFGKKPIFRLRT